MKKIKHIKNLPNNACYNEMESPVGKLTIVASSQGLHAILWDNYRKSTECEKIIADLPKTKNQEILLETKKQLSEYFQCKRKKFDLPLVLAGTPFQIQAWKQLTKIPYGRTISYAQQAERIGNKNKARVVGLANGLNPISIIIPCHRVIGSNGDLTGFGGGVEKKSKLLQLEKNN